MRAFPTRSSPAVTAAPAESRLTEIDAEKRQLKRTIQDCQTKIEQLDAEKDKLYFQLATEARQSSNGSSQHELSSYPSPYASNGDNGYHAADQSDMQAPPGFSQVSPALQQRLGRQQEPLEQFPVPSSYQLDHCHPFPIHNLLFPPDCTDMFPTGRPIPPTHAHCSPSPRPPIRPSVTPLNPSIRFRQQVYSLANPKPLSVTDSTSCSNNSSVPAVHSRKNDMNSNNHAAAPATEFDLFGQVGKKHFDYPNTYLSSLCQQPSNFNLHAHYTVQHQQPNALMQAFLTGNSLSVNSPSAEHIPNSAQSNGAKSNGRPVTPSSGVFARLGVPTTRPIPQGPDSRGRPQPYPSSSPSTALAGNVDQHPPGFASPMKVPSTTSPGIQSATDSGVSCFTPPGYNKSMHADRVQPHQAGSDSLQRPVPQSESHQSRSGGANGRASDLPPGFNQPNGQTDHSGGAPNNSNEVDRSAMPGQLTGNDDGSAPGSSNGASEQAHMSWAEEAAAADESNEEFPGLSFGIKGFDQRKKVTPPDSQQDFPSLGGPGGGDAGPKPAGVWGKGSGALKLQQNQVAASLVAASQTPQQRSSPAVHVEHLELSAGLRVAGDDAADSVRRRRAKRHVFEKMENVRGLGNVNIVQGLELIENVLSPDEQANMIAIVEEWVVQGKQGRLRGRTFSAPRKWAKGKGRITCQFGCCYNYAVDKDGRQPGIVAEEVVEKMPPVLLSLCKRLVRWGVLPKNKEPDTAIINVYDTEDCIPPHIDHHDFDRPFCTISLLSEQSIMFGTKIISRGPGDFACDFQAPLPKGSCLVLKGNGADVSQHCVPPVSSRRISITLRRMADVHAQRVLAMAERVHAGLPVADVDTSSGPKRISADDAYDIDERQQAQQRAGRRYR